MNGNGEDNNEGSQVNKYLVNSKKDEHTKATMFSKEVHFDKPPERVSVN
jgi:hypothetical protein